MKDYRTCQNCRAPFTIEPEDFVFYEKMSVPPPTWCSNCRFIRRMSFRNGWHLFKKTEYLRAEKVFSLFPEESPYKIYEKEYWNSDAWDPMAYGRDYDWNKSFFKQFHNLMLDVPHPAHSIVNLVNCKFCTNANNLKNCYLVRASSYCEDSAYLIWDDSSKQCLDSHMTDHCELSYGNTNVVRSFKTHYSVDCEECSDVVLSRDCISCTRCVGCVGLRNKSNCIFNIEYSKEEFLRMLSELNLGSYSALDALRKKACDFWHTHPQKFMHGRQNADVSGDYIYESKNTKQSYRVRQCEDSKFLQNILRGPVKDCYDYSNWGDNVELLYECLVCGSGNSRLKFCMQCYPNNSEMEYCVFCQTSSHLFGCVGLKRKQYCILNKQYDKHEYELLVDRIKNHMVKTPFSSKSGNIYSYGEFFPTEFSYFPYHISEAAEYFNMSDFAASKSDYAEYEIKRDTHDYMIMSDTLPDNIADASNSLLREVIGCQHDGACSHVCSKAFRIIKEELAFCKYSNLPLPRLCPSCRYYERIAWRNKPNFRNRSCMCKKANHHHGIDKCLNTFETSYSTDRPEILYCESCYLSEVQ